MFSLVIQIMGIDFSHIATTYGVPRFYPIEIVGGEGCYLTDSDGKKYLDLLVGLGVNTLGHNHPKMVEAERQWREQKRVSHVSNLYIIPEQIEYANLLSSYFPLKDPKFFFCNSGAEANETAIKASSKNPDQVKFIACVKGSFHGRYGVSNAVTAQTPYNSRRDTKERWKTSYQNVIELERNNLGEVEKITEDVFAFIYEPIQAEFGIYEMSLEFISALRKRCDETGTTMICDEVQTGFGRTGELFTSELFGQKNLPDTITMAKGIASGEAAMGAVGFSEKSNRFIPGEHASTFGGNPKACRYAITTLQTIIEDNLVENAKRMHNVFKTYSFEDLSCVKEVRGRGLLEGIELVPEKKAKDVIDECMHRGVIVGPAENNTIRLEPPLIITEQEFTEGLDILQDVLKKI